jgi:hypothetical protein
MGGQGQADSLGKEESAEEREERESFIASVQLLYNIDNTMIALCNYPKHVIFGDSHYSSISICARTSPAFLSYGWGHLSYG